MDKLIEVVNRESDYHRVNTFYSTPELYTQEKHRESLTWSLKRDDFVPICQNNPEPTQGHKFWAGFFSSRSSLKYHHRRASSYLQAARKLQWQAALPLRLHVNETELDAFTADDTDLSPLASAVALMTHHDAITGTEKQFVADDYAYRMSRAAAIADRVTSHALRVLIGEPGDVSLVRCPDMNASSCHLSSQSGLERFTVVVYNPMGRPRAIPVRLPIADADTASTISVTSSGAEVRSAVLPAPPVTRLQRAGLPRDTAKQLLVFEADVPALAARTFTVHRHSAKPLPFAEAPPPPPSSSVLENSHLRVEFGDDGLIASIEDKASGLRTKLSQSWRYYVADSRGPAASTHIKQASGAYMFRPE